MSSTLYVFIYTKINAVSYNEKKNGKGRKVYSLT